MSAVPIGWQSVPIGQIADIVSGGTPPSKDERCFAQPGNGIPWLTPADLSGYKHQTISHGSRDLSEFGLQSCSAKQMPAGTVLFSSRAPIGYVAIAANPICTNQGFKSFVFPSPIDSRFAYYQLKHIKPIAEAVATGTTFKELSGSAASKLPFAIAPAAEQKRIADKLDTVLTRVDAVNTRLARVAPLLKRFRQSVLAAATSGRLTEDWRGSSTTQQSQPSSTESWQQLAERMRLTAWLNYAKERQGTNDQAVAKRYKAAQSIATDHDSLPKGWQKVCADQVTFLITDGKHGDCENQDRSGYFFLSVKDLRNGALDYKSARQITKKDFDEVDFRTSLQAGDVLITNAGTIGRVAVVRDQALARRSTLQKSIAVLKPVKELLVPDFLAFSLQSKISLLNDQASGTAVKNLLLSDLRKVEIELPAKEEQTEIVRRVETLFAFADRLEARLAQAQTAATRLTPALLANAFRGELVPQDPNDEPAAELLRRLAEKPATPAKRGRAAKAI